ncbi:MAG: aldose epimerase family protein [Myxococcota bacterium]|jgi:aldose 1-epimerase|nr:aldose epimerase family protein [Myxococcota bacterium]
MAPASSSVQTIANPSGENFQAFILEDGQGARAMILEWGATLASLEAPDRTGRTGHLVRGFADPLDFTRPHPYLNGIVGRVANRIRGGRFELDGVRYQLACNDHLHHLHGGPRGFDRVRWDGHCGTDGTSVTLHHTSEHGTEGYPGRLRVTATYTLEDHVLALDLEATTDRPTLVNLSHHAYWNLSGTGDVSDHLLDISGDQYTPTHRSLVPTGKLGSVDGTPLDFRVAMRLGDLLGAGKLLPAGYDHHLVVRGDPGQLRRFANLSHPPSGRNMELYATHPGLQLYTGGGLDGSLVGRGGDLVRFGGVCLEPQHFPDAPHHANFPTIVLRPDQHYVQRMEFRLSAH